METASIYYGHVLKPFFSSLYMSFLMRQFKIKIIWKLLYQNNGNKYVLIQKKKLGLVKKGNSFTKFATGHKLRRTFLDGAGTRLNGTFIHSI
jgi:hypothetical protein